MYIRDLSHFYSIVQSMEIGQRLELDPLVSLADYWPEPSIFDSDGSGSYMTPDQRAVEWFARQEIGVTFWHSIERGGWTLERVRFDKQVYETIGRETIAAMGNVERFRSMGDLQTLERYSVAQHSLAVAALMPPRREEPVGDMYDIHDRMELMDHPELATAAENIARAFGYPLIRAQREILNVMRTHAGPLTAVELNRILDL